MANKKSHNKGYSSNNKNNTTSRNSDTQKPNTSQQNSFTNSSFANSSFGTGGTLGSSVFGTTNNKPANSSLSSTTNPFGPPSNKAFGSGTFGSSFSNKGGFGSGTTSISGSGGFGSSSFASLTKPSTSGFGQSSFASIGVLSTQSGGGFGTSNVTTGSLNSTSGTQFGNSPFAGTSSVPVGFGKANSNAFNSSFTSSLNTQINSNNGNLSSTIFTKTPSNAGSSKGHVTGGGGFTNSIIPTNSAPKFDPTIKSDKYLNIFSKVAQKTTTPMSAALDAKETMTVVMDKTLIEQLTEKFNDLFQITNENLVNEKLIHNYFGQLTEDDKHAFSSPKFHIGKIPEVPPSEEYCK